MAAFLWMLAVLPQVPTEPLLKDAVMIPLVAPPPAQPQPMPKPVHVRLPRRVFHVAPARIQVPRYVARREQAPVIREHRMEMPKVPKVESSPMPPAPLPKLAVVHPAAFSTGSTAKPTIRRPIEKVQTGGFGDPQGLPGHAEGGSKGNVAKLGSFDLPTGPGKGNGSGGAHGVQGVVASAGFGSGIARRAEDGYGRGPVASSGFGNAETGTDARRNHQNQGTPAFVPAVIVSKPDPVYPAEAKKLHIEGEVLLSTVFQASGHVEVLHVIRGLGHGMDEAAVRAAEGIVFKPARRDGRPVDSEAVVHIVFQLAY